MIPAFERARPGLSLQYLTTSASSFDDDLSSRLDAGTASDIVSCRSFDRSLGLYEAGHLREISDLDTPGLSGASFRAWSTPDGSERYCVPVSSVMQGFVYNMDILATLGLEPPATQVEFVALLETIKADGQFVPLAIGLKDAWRVGNLGLHILGPSFWGGDAGREALAAGDGSFDGPEFVELFEALQVWGEHLPEAADFVDSSEAWDLFANGSAAIYPAGSWELGSFDDVEFSVSAFPPPLPDGATRCAVIDHPDLGFGINTDSSNTDAAIEFLEWAATDSFGGLYSNSLVGQFSLHESVTTVDHHLAQQFASWRQLCDTSLRLTARGFDAGTRNIEREIWEIVGGVVAGVHTPETAAKLLQALLRP